VVKALQKESREVQLWDRLGTIKCPTLIMRGGGPEALLKPEETDMYLQYLPHAEVVVFQESGHELWRPDYEKYIGVIHEFLSRLEGGRGGEHLI
jgi:pimeloyl-ACP methyl ester carboxylesterase